MEMETERKRTRLRTLGIGLKLTYLDISSQYLMADFRIIVVVCKYNESIRNYSKSCTSYTTSSLPRADSEREKETAFSSQCSGKY